MKSFRNKPDTNAFEKGRPRIYSDDAILCCSPIKTVYQLPLRVVHGFLVSLVKLLNLNIPIPSYNQISRRTEALDQKLKKLSHRHPKNIVFDSTGLKVYGEGEWKVRQHGTSKKRTRRKLDIGLDSERMEIIVAELTDNGEVSGDAQTADKMLKKYLNPYLKKC